MSQLEIKDLHVSIEDKEILKGLTLTIKQGEIHAIMGPNGTGKSTLAYTLMGHPNYTVTSGEVLLDGENVLEMEPDERSRAGIFLAFQYPVAIPGVTVANFLRSAINSRRRAENPEDKGMPIPEFRKMLKEKMDALKMDQILLVVTSMMVSPAAKRSAPRSCRWQPSNRVSPFWMKLTLVWISMRFALYLKV